jgi:hypothetical protein
MKYFEVDRTHLPVIIYRINPIEPTLKMHEEFLTQSIDDMREFPGLITIMDLTNAKSLSAEVRIQQGNWNKKNEAFMKEHMKGIVFVNKSAVMAFMLKAIFLIQKPAVPYQVVSDFNEGLAWAKKQILEKSIA